MLLCQADWDGSGQQWNPPTSAILAPGEAMTVGWRLHLASSIRKRDAALAAVGLAVAQGVPGRPSIGMARLLRGIVLSSH